jgi:hypothetical protein
MKLPPLTQLPHRRARLLTLIALAGLTLGGCAVVAVASTVASVAVGTVGLVADAAIGTVRIAGKVVGAGADAVLPSDKH